MSQVDNDTASLKVNIQGSLVKFTLDIFPTDTILQVKEKICGIVNDAQPASLKLIYSGRILKDSQSAAECEIQTGHTIHLVKSQTNKPTSSAGTAPEPSKPQPQSTPTQTLPPLTPLTSQLQGSLLSALLGNAGQQQPPPQQQGESGGSNQQQPRMDDLLGTMMEEMVANPDLVNTMIQNYSSQMNPETLAVVRNPQLLRVCAQMMRSGAFGDVSRDGRVLGNMGEGDIGRLLNLNQPPPATGTTGQSEESTADPEEKYASQLQQLRDMGFWDKKSNLQALIISNGSVSQAVEYLLSHPPE